MINNNNIKNQYILCFTQNLEKKNIKYLLFQNLIACKNESVIFYWILFENREHGTTRAAIIICLT